MFCVLSKQTKNMLSVYTLQYILDDGCLEFRKRQCVGSLMFMSGCQNSVIYACKFRHA